MVVLESAPRTTPPSNCTAMIVVWKKRIKGESASPYSPAHTNLNNPSIQSPEYELSRAPPKNVTVKSLSRVRLFATPWTVAYQAPLSMGFSRQYSTEVDCQFLRQGIIPTQGSNPGLPHCRQKLYRLSHWGKYQTIIKSHGGWVSIPRRVS